jgi:NAD(P) transhydrogenase subunit alpha
MLLAVPAETAAGERRVAAVPETVGKLAGAGYEVRVQQGAGAAALYPDDAYAEQGATITDGDPFDGADVVAKVRAPSVDEAGRVRKGATWVSLFAPGENADALRALAERGATAFGLEFVPRISRAQSMDALSSQALVGGYRAALIAADSLPKFFPMFMTAAGTVPPAKVLVLGAGVAGLQAIATVKRLGAVVEAYDVRTAAAEEVRSLGASFLELELESQEGAGGYAKEQTGDFAAKQQQLLTERVAASDAVITTAAVPGRKAPVLVTEAMVGGMRPGSIVVDLAAETGGNCELSQAGQTVEHGGVRVVGLAGAPSQLAPPASALFARNIANLLLLMTTEGTLAPDFDDEVVAGCCLLKAGEPMHQAAKDALGAKE